jgi:hypothetical protein
MFFFEKKNQKTFVHLTSLYPETPKPAPNQLLPVDVRARRRPAGGKQKTFMYSASASPA